ncbi:MAG: UDP-galactopyranose mutase, partial [Odoribacter sp.]|nr:UDP-galactopyranose mutase [Odoribacter sp.]
MNTFNKLWGVITPTEAQKKIEEQRSQYTYIGEPINLEEQALKLCGEDIYNIFIKGYTEKQWGRSAKELPNFIIRRIPFRFTYDNNYFNDRYQGIPIGGYNLLIDKLLESVEVKLNIDYFNNRGYFDGIADKIIYTGCIDEFFNYEYGNLEYRSLRFEEEHLDISDYQGNAVVNYNEKEIPFTRIIEHKHFEYGQQPYTVITREFPQEFKAGYEPYYPINDRINTKRLDKYKEKAKNCPNVILGGRLAEYAYFDMDDTIEAALQVAEKELKNR